MIPTPPHRNETQTLPYPTDNQTKLDEYKRLMEHAPGPGSPLPPERFTWSATPEKVDPNKLVEGYKADESKVRMDLIPPEFIFATADILTFGAEKYSDRNWEKGMKWGRPFGAAMRHLWAWWGGKTVTNKNFLLGDFDAETRRSHLWHAACCLAFLIAYEARGIGTDDRHISS